MSLPQQAFLSHTKLGITRDEREGLLAVALLLPTLKHTPYPNQFKYGYPPYPKLKTFDMCHVRYKQAGCTKAWMAELGYLDDNADTELYSDAMYFLFYPRVVVTYAEITPLMAANAIYKFLRTGNALDAYT